MNCQHKPIHLSISVLRIFKMVLVSKKWKRRPMVLSRLGWVLGYFKKYISGKKKKNSTPTTPAKTTNDRTVFLILPSNWYRQLIRDTTFNNDKLIMQGMVANCDSPHFDELQKCKRTIMTSTTITVKNMFLLWVFELALNNRKTTSTIETQTVINSAIGNISNHTKILAFIFIARFIETIFKTIFSVGHVPKHSYKHNQVQCSV